MDLPGTSSYRRPTRHWQRVMVVLVPVILHASQSMSSDVIGIVQPSNTNSNHGVANMSNAWILTPLCVRCQTSAFNITA